jgi:hypothetical protein
MAKTLVINSSNYVENSGNKYIYKFPNTTHFEVGSAIGVANISMYNSIQNVTMKRGNNVLTLNWLGTEYVFNIPDGYYSVSDLNFFIQQQCILRGLYMTANGGADNVYFTELVINSVRYSTSVNFYTIPTESEASAKGYVKPSNATWAYPTTGQTPRLSFNQGMGNLIGFTFGTYPLANPQTSNIQILSTQSPKISPVDSLILTCNLVNSKYSIPNDVFFTLPLSSSVGSLINFSNSTLIYNSIVSQNFSTLEINFYDQLFQPVFLLDRELCLQLSLLDASEQRR